MDILIIIIIIIIIIIKWTLEIVIFFLDAKHTHIHV